MTRYGNAGTSALSEPAELHLVHAWHAVGESAMHGPFMHRPEQEVEKYVEEVRREQTARLDDLLSNTPPESEISIAPNNPLQLRVT